MLEKIIQKINHDFLEEALSSPRLLEDMASMEKFMAESYGSRIFIELLQNADDSNSSKIKLCEFEGHLIFANNGKPFSEQDVVSISRSGSSSKMRGQKIGYRGVGFKSTTYLTDEIVIYSDYTFFTFSKALCANKLQMDESKVPTIRIPFPVDTIETSIKQFIGTLVDEGYTTIFIFKNANIEAFREEIKDVNNGYFLFLNNIKLCEIILQNDAYTFTVNRHTSSNGTLITLKGKGEEQWLIAGDTRTNLAFKYNEGRIIPCTDEEAVYHCYLPTLDKSMFPFKINGNFSTDPSRKHLTIDEVTTSSLNLVANTIFALLEPLFYDEANEKFTNFLIMLNQKLAFSKVNSILDSILKKIITTKKWLQINSLTFISPIHYKLLPDWLEESEKIFIRTKSEYVKKQSIVESVYKNTIQVDDFLRQYSNTKYTVAELILMLKEYEFVVALNVQTYGKIMGNIIKSAKSEQFLKGNDYNFDTILIRCLNGIKTLSQISQEPCELDSELKQAIRQFVSKADLEWFCKITSIKQELFSYQKVETFTTYSKFEVRNNTIENKPTISKWRSAEQQCVELEKHFGHKAIDVSKQNVGYDVKSITSDGEERYIEVKAAPYNGSSFSMTNNEFSAAYQYGENYYICLIVQNEKNLSAIYIKNPLKNLQFEKRVRQWEWYCENYVGEEFLLSFNSK